MHRDLDSLFSFGRAFAVRDGIDPRDNNKGKRNRFCLLDRVLWWLKDVR